MSKKTNVPKAKKPAAAKPAAAPAAAPEPALKASKCRALEVGHRSCHCGGEYCQPKL